MANCMGTLTFSCLQPDVKAVFVVLSGVLGISLFFNIYFCALKWCSGKKASLWKTKRSSSQSSRQIADNPIYGNISSTRVLYTEVDASHSLHRDQHRVKLNSKECYANLTQTPVLQPVLSSSQPQATQYSDIVDVVEVEMEKIEESTTDDVSTMSDLYASVQTQRSKAILTAEGEEEYANHL